MVVRYVAKKGVSMDYITSKNMHMKDKLIMAIYKIYPYVYLLVH